MEERKEEAFLEALNRIAEAIEELTATIEEITSEPFYTRS